MTQEHQTFSLAIVYSKLPKTEFIKIDLSDLQCRLCAQSFASVQDVATHLNQDHNKGICLDNPLGVMPYKLEKDSWICAVCSKTEPTLHHLNKHTITHFLSYVCEICGKSYVASTGLIQHVKAKHDVDNKATCRRCRRAFPSLEAKVKHQKTDKRCMRHCCSLCPERFPIWELKQRHMSEVHGETKRKYQCPDCNIKCNDRRAFYDHFKTCHSQECLVCVHCGLKFASASKLNRHLGKHAV